MKLKNRKGMILADLGVAAVMLSAISAMYLSGAQMQFNNSKIDFIAQKKTFFDSMITKVSEDCRTYHNPNMSIGLNDKFTIMSNYEIFYNASCTKNINDSNVYDVVYNQCIYPLVDPNGAERKTGFVSTNTPNFEEKHCKTGTRYVKI